jgi:formylglycine-generating enzyme required for sulfatase activity
VSIILYFIFQFLALSSIEYSTQYIQCNTHEKILKIKKATTITFIGKKQQNEILDQHFVEKYFMGEFALFSSSLYENVTFFVDFLFKKLVYSIVLLTLIYWILVLTDLLFLKLNYFTIKLELLLGTLFIVFSVFYTFFNFLPKVKYKKVGQAEVTTENIGNGVSLEMVKIPRGTFTMGSPKSEKGSYDYERPQHDVTVPQFFMGKYPVTQGQWKAIASRTDLKVKLDLELDPSRFKERYKNIDRWKRPVECINWYEAVEFCKRLSKLTGRNYRLPSEAEWEYACRAGTTTPFYFGETITTELVNYNSNYTYGNGPKGKYRKQTIPVGQFPANAFGLYDMHGNVWEWCADELHDNYAGAPTDGSVWLNGNKDKSPLRGGSWANSPNNCRSAIRNNYHRRDDHIINSGFRVVCDGGRTL